MSSECSTIDTSDSIASSYRASNVNNRHVRETCATLSSSLAHVNRTEQQRIDTISDELIQHPTIMKLQQENFHRLLSSASSTTSSSASVSKRPDVSSSPVTFSSRLQSLNTSHRLPSTNISLIHESTPIPHELLRVTSTTDAPHRAVLHERKQALMKAIQTINQQMEALNMQ
jgi:hypothetical protein